MSAVPSEISVWAERCIDDAEFWDSTPSWPAGMARRDLDHHLVGLGPTGLLVVPPPSSVLARFFDGDSTLAELAEDLADAAEATLDQARWMTAMTTIELHAIGALIGVRAPDAPSDPLAAVPSRSQVGGTDLGDVATSTRLDPTTGEELQVEQYVNEDGDPVTVVHQPDGTRRVTVEHTYRIDQGEQAISDAGLLAEELMGGRRSVAELVPAGTCLGQKLRIGEHPDVVNVRCPDGIVRSVRCHDPEVGEALAERARDRLVSDGASGPVEVFVTIPFEGDGPRRVYDGRGERRGRPRAVDEVVDLVDRLLGEATMKATDGPDSMVMSVLLARRGHEVMLVHRAVEADHRARGELRRAGWELTGVAAALFDDRTVGCPSALGVSSRVSFDAVRPGPILRGFTAPEMLVQIVGNGTVNASMPATLDLLVDLVTELSAPVAA